MRSFPAVYLACIVISSSGCSGNAETRGGLVKAESRIPPPSVYVNLLELKDFKRFWWEESEGSMLKVLHQTTGSDVAMQLKECESTELFACIEIQPGFPLRLPCDEGVLSETSYPEISSVGLVGKRSGPIHGRSEYMFEIGTPPTRVRVGYVYSVGVTSFLYLQEEKIDLDSVQTIPKSNAIYIATDDPFDPIPVLCSNQQIQGWTLGSPLLHGRRNVEIFFGQ